MTLPRLADIAPTRQRFKAGDRLIVFTGTLDAYSRKRLRRATIRYAREPVRVLLVDCLRVNLFAQNRLTNTIRALSSPERIQRQTLKNVVNVSCDKVELESNELIVVDGIRRLKFAEKREFEAELRDWAGEVEIIFI